MRQAMIRFFLLIGLLYPASVHGATCPNLSAHPGITTIFLQTDFGEKDAGTKAYVAGLEAAIKKYQSFCLVEDLRAASFALDLAGVDLGEDHERAALSLVIISEKGTLVSHWVRLSSIENVDKNSQDDVVKVDRAIQRYKRHR
jgi:hypothetical protein